MKLRKSYRRSRFEAGLSLVQVLVAASLMAVLAVGMMQMMGGFGRDMASITRRGEFEEVKTSLRRRLSCEQTFPNRTCADAIGPRGQVILRDNSGAAIFADYDYFDPSAKNVDERKRPFANSYRLGQTMARIRAQCGVGSVEIFLANWGRDMFPQDPWPGAPQMELCQERLGGNFINQCAGDQRMRGINKETLEPICVPNSVGCPSGQYLKAIEFDANSLPQPICRNLPTGCGPNEAIDTLSYDADGNAVRTCSRKALDVENRINNVPTTRRVAGDFDKMGLEDLTKNMFKGKCEQYTVGQAEIWNTGWNFEMGKAEGVRTGIRGFRSDGTPLCAPVAGDINGDGYGDLVYGAGNTGGPRVGVFWGAGNGISQANLDFFAYEESFRGGAHVGVVDINGDGLADVLTGPGPGGSARVRAFQRTDLDGVTKEPNSTLGNVIVPFQTVKDENGKDVDTWRGGVIVGP